MLENEKSLGGFGKLPYIPGNEEGPTHVQGCVQSQERSEKALISHL